MQRFHTSAPERTNPNGPKFTPAKLAAKPDYSKGFGATVNARRRPTLFNNPTEIIFTSRLDPP